MCYSVGWLEPQRSEAYFSPSPFTGLTGEWSYHHRRVSVSLDKRVIPVGVWPESGPRLLLGAVATLLLLLVIGQLPFMAGVHNAIRSFCERHNVELYDKLAYRYRCVALRPSRLFCVMSLDCRPLAAACGLLAFADPAYSLTRSPPSSRLLKGRVERIRDGVCRRWRQRYPREVTVLPASAFPVPLTLLERTYIGGAFMKYRFAFPQPTQVRTVDGGEMRGRIYGAVLFHGLILVLSIDDFFRPS